jgi:hypothetical protein
MKLTPENTRVISRVLRVLYGGTAAGQLLSFVLWDHSLDKLTVAILLGCLVFYERGAQQLREAIEIYRTTCDEYSEVCRIYRSIIQGRRGARNN